MQLFYSFRKKNVDIMNHQWYSVDGSRHEPHGAHNNITVNRREVSGMDLVELKMQITKSGLKKYEIAEKLGICGTSLRNKLKGKREFKASEAIKLKEILGLSDDDLNRIFFTPKGS